MIVKFCKGSKVIQEKVVARVLFLVVRGIIGFTCGAINRLEVLEQIDFRVSKGVTILQGLSATV